MLHALRNASHFVTTDATESNIKRIWEVATLEEAGSRFPDEIYHQSDGFESIIALICSRNTSYEEQTKSGLENNQSGLGLRY